MTKSLKIGCPYGFTDRLELNIDIGYRCTSKDDDILKNDKNISVDFSGATVSFELNYKI